MKLVIGGVNQDDVDKFQSQLKYLTPEELIKNSEKEIEKIDNELIVYYTNKKSITADASSESKEAINSILNSIMKFHYTFNFILENVDNLRNSKIEIEYENNNSLLYTLYNYFKEKEEFEHFIQKSIKNT